MMQPSGINVPVYRYPIKKELKTKNTNIIVTKYPYTKNITTYLLVSIFNLF